MVEKRFKLDLSAYDIEVDTVKEPGAKPVKEKVEYPLRSNISTWLRTAGMFKTTEDVAEAVCLAKQIRETINKFAILDAKEATILKRVVDRHLELAAEHGVGLGGEIHEEAICRVANMEEVEDTGKK